MQRKSLLFFLPVAAAAVALCFWKVADPDVFWHLKAGQVMLEQRRLLTLNTFSSLFPEHPWQDNEWLFQLLLAGVYNAWGWAGVAAFKIAVVLALGALVYTAALARGVGPLLAASGATAALAIMQHRLTERPHLFSYVFLALTVLLVSRRDRSPRALWALPPLFVVWSNTHPEVVFGLLYLGLVAAGEQVNALARRRTGDRQPAPRLPLLAVACLGGTLVNPWGPHLLAMPFSILKHESAVLEYGFSSFGDTPTFWAFLLAAVLLAVAARRQRDWSEVLPALVFGLLAVRMQRVIPFFLIATTPWVLQGASTLAEGGGTRRRFRVGALCSLAAYGALVWALAFERPGLYVWGWGISETTFPAAAADVLRAESWQGNLYNPYREGGYLVYRLYPNMGVLQDGRGGAYPRDFLRRLNSAATPQELPRILGDYSIQIALFNLSEVNPGFDRSRWGIVFWDDDYCLMARRDSPNREIVERLEYRSFLPGVDVSRETDHARIAELVREMERNQAARRLPSAVLANTIGFLHARLGELPEAVLSFREATRIDGDYAAAWSNLGRLLMETGHPEEAEAARARAAKLDPRLGLPPENTTAN